VAGWKEGKMAEVPDEPRGELVLYQTEDGRTRIECRFANETLWLSQALIAELFQVTVPTVNEHLRNLYDEGELAAEATIRKFRIVRLEGTREVAREIEHYSLDAILAVGFRVRSTRGTQFRRWATERLSEYLVKGFVMDDQRLKNPLIRGFAAPDYFDELLERIRDIRASERRMYLRVREIFALAGDYDPKGRAQDELRKALAQETLTLYWAKTGFRCDCTFRASGRWRYARVPKSGFADTARRVPRHVARGGERPRFVPRWPTEPPCGLRVRPVEPHLRSP
jgi:hypothetical protein